MAITAEDLMAVGFASQQAEMLIALFEEYAMLVPIVIGGSASLDFTTSSERVAIPTPKGNQLIITSSAYNPKCFINVGGDDVEATLSDYPVLPGTQQTITILPSQTHFAAISLDDGVIEITTGDGT